MSAEIIEGRRHAQAVLDTVAADLRHLPRSPGLAVVLVGDDPASHIYVRSKVKAAEQLGLRGETRILPDNISETELLAIVGELNERDDIDGILVQLPLPKHIDALRVMGAVDPAKDVD